MDLPRLYKSLKHGEKREVREEYRKLQDNLCYFCKTSLDIRPKMDKKINWRRFPSGFLDYPIHLHHSHDTGLTLGAVHAYCNAVLWQYHGE